MYFLLKSSLKIGDIRSFTGVFQWLKPPKLYKFPIHKKNINFGQESELVARIASDWGVAVPWNLWYGFHGWLVGWLVGWLLCLTLKKSGRMEEGDVCVCVCFCDICKVPILRFFILKHVTTKDTEVWWSMLVDERLNSDTSTYELLVARIKESFRLRFVHNFWCDRISTSV